MTGQDWQPLQTTLTANKMDHWFHARGPEYSVIRILLSFSLDSALEKNEKSAN